MLWMQNELHACTNCTYTIHVHVQTVRILVECRTLEGEPERSACVCRTCKEQLHSHQNVTGQ